MDRADDPQAEARKEPPKDSTACARSRTVGSWNRAVQWVLLDGNRLVVAGGLLAVLLVAYTALESNIEDVSDFRERVRQETGREVAPEEPAPFLELLLRSTREETNRLHSAAVAIGDEDLQADVDDATNRLTDHVEHVLDLLDRPDTGVFGALAATLSTNYARELNAVRKIEVRYADRLSEEAGEALGNITRRIKDGDIALQYFKTMYIQEELSYFSRLLLYVGIPAEFLTILHHFVTMDIID